MYSAADARGNGLEVVMVRRGVASWVRGGILVALWLGSGCNLLIGADDVRFETGGTGEGSTSGGAGSGGVTTGGTTTGGSTTGGTTGGTGGSTGTPCAQPSDCPDPGNPCVSRYCVDMICGTEAVPAGTQAGTQTAGDCKVFECDGAGTLAAHPDDADLPDDMNDCTADTCVAGEPTFTPLPSGDTCASGTGYLCDGAGNCVECLVADDCPGQDSECQTRTCDLGVCGIMKAIQGGVVAAQTQGDCLVNQCDGNGGIEAVPDDLDIVNDGNDCTDNTCNNGVPQIANTPINTPCSMGGILKCDGAGQCVGCTGSADCGNGGNPCLNPVCNAGTCGTTPKANGTACNDSDACTQTDTCQAGACTGANPVVCTAQDQCHDVGTCNAATGVCSNPTKANGASCSDGDLCTQGDTCQFGACSAGTPVTCMAQDQCHNVGTCAPATGLCSNPNKANGTTCSDGNACTQTDTCQAGACAGANPKVCTAQDQCHDPGTCAPATGVCSNPNKANGSTCNDGNLCTQTDTCQAGACTGANPVVCTAQDQCHDVGTCNMATGFCSNPNKANGATCNDGNLCTQTDTCQAGACTGANPMVCAAQDQCHNVGTCNMATGVCSNPNKANGTACADGNACTQTDTCQAGVCTGANAPNGTACPGGTCTAGSCILASCGDMTKNGTETAVDCGGGACPTCANGLACLVNADCTSGHCVGNVCVQCAVANDCPGTDTACQTRTCSSNICGFSFQPNGFVIASQTPGDCKEIQCNGSGGTTTVNKNTDLPVDNNQCTNDVCTSGTPSNPILPVNTPCNQNGGTVCNAAGSCVAAFTVTAISPADAATGVVSPSLIQVTFSAAPLAATVTGQTTNGACTGSIQLSADNFTSCLAFASAAPVIAGNTVAMIPVPGLSLGRTYKVRVKSTITNAAGLPLAADVNQATGFTTETLPATCGVSGVVIAQVYGGGGAATAPFKSDFVVLFNGGAAPVDLSTWAVQYAATAGTTWVVANLTGTVNARAYFLVKLGGNSGLQDLPTPDATPANAISMGATAGKVALTNDQTALSGACPAGAQIIDLVGYGTGTTCFEGAGPTPTINASLAVVRKGFGCVDTNSNPSDFGVGQVNPLNSTFRQPLNETGQSGQAGQLGNEADYCALFSPASITALNGSTSPQILGRIYEAGVTEAAGGSASVTAQVGYGPATANPEVTLFTAWTAATFTQQTGPFGNDDEYGATFTLPVAGTYAYAFRFSLDGGNRWTYCDLDKTASGGDSGAGASGGLAFQSETMGVLTSQ